MSETENFENSMHQVGELEQCDKTDENGHIILELSKICRCCLLERNDLRSLFDEEPYCISDMIMTFVPVQV